jgi:Protein of unknown function (DUF3572)
MFKKPKPKALDRNAAEEIAVKALAFLAVDDRRLGDFFSLTGIAPGDLIAGAAQAPMLAAVLGHLSTDESMLLVFCAETGTAPEHVGVAMMLLEDAA